MNRREFLHLLGGAGLGAAAGCRTCAPRPAPEIALQLYSIHKIFWSRPERILAELKAGGFDGVEFAGYGGRTAKDIRRLLADAGLKGAGTHVSRLEAFTGDGATATLDFCAEAGLESCTNPHAKFETADDYRRFGETMGAFAERAAREYGIQAGVHTAFHHFTQTFGGATAWDLIFANASPRLQQQVDTSQAFHTGQDVVALLRRYRNRHHSLHMKENVPTVDGVFGVPPTDGGTVVPWDDILAYMATETGHRWYIVEAEGRPDDLAPCLLDCQFLRRKLKDRSTSF